MSEQSITEPRPQVATWAPGQTGSCARGHASTCRYGVGGNPLCKGCRLERDERLARIRP
ncbi:hypothetical protein ACFWCB_11290 [Streptomyces sp. NPDC060048]|uniref:hypothetical protein n=1 Tax=unclassified Streptomyces TaxID=2593676 RepID=UPI0036CE0A5A